MLYILSIYMMHDMHAIDLRRRLTICYSCNWYRLMHTLHAIVNAHYTCWYMLNANYLWCDEHYKFYLSMMPALHTIELWCMHAMTSSNDRYTYYRSMMHSNHAIYDDACYICYRSMMPATHAIDRWCLLHMLLIDDACYTCYRWCMLYLLSIDDA